MEVIAKAKWIRSSPRKLRLIADQIRGMKTQDAMKILKFMPQRGARIIAKTVKSAMSNAENNNALNTEFLYIKKIFIDGGPSLKRFLPRALGRATPIKKRTSHITVVLEEMEEIKDKVKGKVKKEDIKKSEV